VAEPLSVIHVLGFPIDFNGNITRVLGEAIHVAKLGINVEILVSDQVPAAYLERAVSNGVKIRSLDVLVPWRAIGWRINNIFPLLLRGLQIVRKKSNCILHVSAPSPVTKALTASEIGKRLGKPVVLDLHDPWSANPFSFNPVWMLQTLMMKRVINSVDYIVVAHNALLKLVGRLNSAKPVDVIPNGVDIELFNPTPFSPRLAESIGISREDFVVAFSGHITKAKGLDTLIRSARVIAKMRKKVKFLIIGDGPLLKEIKDRVRESGMLYMFRFTGFVSQASLVEHLSLADVCVAPYNPMSWYRVSLPETPLKVVEYMAMGKPVIMSRISDENIVTWSGGGELVAPGSVSELVSSILKLLEDESLRKALGRRGRKYVEANLSWGRIAEKLVKIYRYLNDFS